MSKQRVHTVIGSGEASGPSVQTSLKDVLEGDDALGLVWSPPHNEAQDAVLEYVLDREIPFVLYYKDGDNPHKLFRNAEFGVVQKVRNPLKAALEGVANGGVVLFLWDDDENPEEGETLIDYVFDTLGEHQLVLSLDHGLSPISVAPPVPIPAPEEVAPAVDEDDDEPLESFTKAELEVMPAISVKNYGAKIGAKGTTKTAIIAELFPDEDEDEDEGETPSTPAVQQKAKPLTYEVENTADFGTVEQELRRFATAAIRLANAMAADTTR